MLLIRCPSCRGFSDAEGGPRCMECGAELPPGGPPASEGKAGALREGRADGKKSSFLLGGLAVLGGLGLGGMSGGLLFLPLLVYVVWANSNERVTRSAFHRFLVRGLAVVGAFVAVGVGLLLLVFIVCLASVAAH